MATQQPSITKPSRSPGDSYGRTDHTPTVQAEDLLELLGDEYSRRLLRAIVDEPRTGGELVDATDMSKSTVYRRLERLEDAGLVEATQRIDPDGHHCKQFRAVVAAVDFEFDRDGVSVCVRTDDSPGGDLVADD
jgi:DNA-binding transcriptional ArsR family regulator